MGVIISDNRLGKLKAAYQIFRILTLVSLRLRQYVMFLLLQDIVMLTVKR